MSSTTFRWLRSALASDLTERFSTNARTSKEFASLAAENLSLDVLAKLYDLTQPVTADALRTFIEKWMADPHVVVVGDATAITGDISTVGLGPPVVKSMP